MLCTLAGNAMVDYVVTEELTKQWPMLKHMTLHPQRVQTTGDYTLIGANYLKKKKKTPPSSQNNGCSAMLSIFVTAENCK